MWEWRFFYLEAQAPQWASHVKKMLLKIPVEERSDLYYNLRSSEFGMKIRSYSENYQLLELKFLRDTNGDFELWEKPIKQTIQLESESLFDYVVSFLESSTHHVIEIKKILEILSSGNFDEVEITKHRKKTSINNVSVESVVIEYQNKKLLGVQLECHTPSLLSKFMFENLAIPVKKYSNTSYPRFLLDL